jgi:hypothetical protein
MSSNQDQILTEQVERYIRSNIPFMVKNLHEAYGEGFGTRLKLFGKEMGNRALAALDRETFRRKSEMNDYLQKSREKILDVHLTKSNINPDRYRTAMSYSPVQPTAPTTNNPAHWNQYYNQMDAWNERQAIEQHVNAAKLKNPGLARIMDKMQKQSQSYGRDIYQAALRADPTISGFPPSAARKVELLRQQRMAMKKQRKQAIPGEYHTYGSYPATSGVFGPRPGFGAKLLSRARPGALGPAPTVDLTGLGKVLQGLETII